MKTSRRMITIFLVVCLVGVLSIVPTFAASKAKNNTPKPPQNISGKWVVCSQITMQGWQLLVKWNPQTKGTTGYQIQVYNTKTKKTTGAAIEPNTRSSATIGVNKKTTYKVRIRTYKRANGKYYYSSWKDWVQVRTL